MLAAGGALAADPGMLYVKSDPPGATVVIGGVERGKTPVLVKGLPAGDTTITLRLEGAKPVVVRETVEANKVATVSADIDVPGASLTVISDPLEATVYLDQREHGKTPITIDGLLPGRHALLLLKAGFPRAARTIVLAAGEERVLEVKLGTADEDEEPAPARKADVGGRSEENTPAEIQAILATLRDAVVKDEYAETRKALQRKLSQRDFAAFREEVQAALRVVGALETRCVAMRLEAVALVGKEVTLKTKAGTKQGLVADSTTKGIVLVSRTAMPGGAAVEARSTISWFDLAPEESDRFAGSWSAEGDDGGVARAIVALARGDESAAKSAAATARDHVLARHLAPAPDKSGDPSGPDGNARPGAEGAAPVPESALLLAEREYGRIAEEAGAKARADLQKVSVSAFNRGDLATATMLDVVAKNLGTQIVPPAIMRGRLGRGIKYYRQTMHRATMRLMAAFESESGELMKKGMVDEAERARKRVVALVEQHAGGEAQLLLLCEIAVRCQESISVATLKTGTHRLSGAFRDPIGHVKVGLTGARFTRAPWKATVTHGIHVLRQGYLYFIPQSPEEVKGIPPELWEDAAGDIRGKYIPKVHRVWLWKGAVLKARAYEGAVIARSIQKR
jgi:hypothetical protein